MTTDKLMKLADAYADESALVGLACGKTKFDAALQLNETRRNDARQALRAAIEQALEALKAATSTLMKPAKHNKAIAALEARLK